MTAAIPSVKTPLHSMFKPGFTSDEKVIIDYKSFTPTEGMFTQEESPVVDVFDGRVLQAQEDDGSEFAESQFFSRHGFVLLDHKSAVQNWDSGAFGPADAIDVGHSRVQDEYQGENEIESKYCAEVESLIRERLLPNKNIQVEQPNEVLRRGEGTANPFYGGVVHNDYGLYADDFEDNLESFSTKEVAVDWRNRYEQDDVIGFMLINFWRTVHMLKPLKHMPLGVLDSSSVMREDCVSSGLKGFTHSGRLTNQLSLRYNKDQRWFYYPDMTTEEVLVLNLFECHKENTKSSIYNSYHSAFEDPNVKGDVEIRQSCEHRVNVFIYKD